MPESSGQEKKKPNFLARTAMALGIMAGGLAQEAKADPASPDQTDRQPAVARTPVKSEAEQQAALEQSRKKANEARRKFDETGIEEPSPFELSEEEIVAAEKERRAATKLSPEEVKKIHPDYNPDIDDKPFVGVSKTSEKRTPIKRDLEKVSPEESARLNAELDNLRKEALEAAEMADELDPNRPRTPNYDLLEGGSGDKN